MKRVLYTGLKTPAGSDRECFISHPLIDVIPENRDHPTLVAALQDLPFYTHLIFTSQSTVRFFNSLIHNELHLLQHIIVIAVGTATANALKNKGIQVSYTAKNECAEGIIEVLHSLNLSDAYILWPRSDRARSVISDYLKQKGIHYRDPILYQTVLIQPEQKIPPTDYEAIMFTSPSGIDGFLAVYGSLPQNKEIRTIGPITKNYLKKIQNPLT